MHNYDLAILGAGPGGYAAALEAARSGKAILLVEPSLLGGTCLNWGCIPTKLFLGATAAGPALETAVKLKLAQGDMAFDLPAMQKRRERITAATRKAMEKKLAGLGVDLACGRGRLAGEGKLIFSSGQDEKEYGFAACIAATGSRPAAFPAMQPDGDCVLDSSQALDLQTPPESLIVVGGGAIGLEMADFFSRLGTSIALVEALDRLAPTEDPDVGETLAQICKRRRWRLLVGQKVRSLATQGGQACMVLESGEEMTAAKALVATGRRPNSEGLGLETAGAKLDHGWAVTDEFLQAAPGVYVVGDLNGRTLLAHAAEHQGRYAARRAFGDISDPYASGPMPACIYGEYEVMRAGISEEEARRQGRAVRATKAMLAGNPIAQAAGATQGFVKAVWESIDGQERVVGMAAVGHGVSHLITQATMIVAAGWTRKDAESIIFAHPTLDESVRDVLLEA